MTPYWVLKCCTNGQAAEPGGVVSPVQPVVRSERGCPFVATILQPGGDCALSLVTVHCFTLLPTHLCRVWPLLSQTRNL